MFHKKLGTNKEPKGTFTKCVRFDFKILGKFLLTMRLAFALVKIIFFMFTNTLKTTRLPMHLKKNSQSILSHDFKKSSLRKIIACLDFLMH
jgi:hypothetical protein